MNCVIPGPNLKLLGKAVHALAKIGDEIYFEANEDHLSLRTVNITTTVFGVIKFLSSFFVHYNINDAETEQTSQKGISCKMPMKAMLAVFRNPNQMEKQIELCKIELNENPIKITFKFRYKNDVSKTHEVLLLDGDESLQVTTLSECFNEITGTSSLYTQALANFQLSDDDVSIEVTPQLCILRNYVEGESIEQRCVRSQLSINPTEFKYYSIRKDTTIAFTLRSFRAAIQFAETFNLAITLTFQEAGKPMEIIISNSTTIEAKFILATMSSNLNTQTTTTTTATTLDFPTKHSFVRKETVLEKSTIENKNNTDYFNSEELDINNIPDDVVMIQSSPESPRSKQLKFHFMRCFEPTFNGLPSTNDEIYAENSDPECEALMY